MRGGRQFACHLPHNLDTTADGIARVLDSLRAGLMATVLGIPSLAVLVDRHGRLRPGVQIMDPAFAQDLCRDAGEVI